MTVTTFSSTFDNPRPVESRRDVSWYGTLGVLAACVAVLAAAFFIG